MSLTIGSVCRLILAIYDIAGTQFMANINMKVFHEWYAQLIEFFFDRNDGIYLGHRLATYVRCDGSLIDKTRLPCGDRSLNPSMPLWISNIYERILYHWFSDEGKHGEEASSFWIVSET